MIVYRAPDLITSGVTVEARTVYGQEKLYPVNVNAKLLARIAGTKTLSRAVLADVIALGLVVVVQGAHVDPIGCASIAAFTQEKI